MTVRECYERLGGDYNDALGRLLTEKRAKKYLLKYASKSELPALEDAMKKKDWGGRHSALRII